MTRRCQLIAASVSVFVIVGTWISAQVIAPERIEPPITISSNDIAFRVEARRGNTVEGRLLVRMDGEWVEADVDGGLRVRRLQSKQTRTDRRLISPDWNAGGDSSHYGRYRN